MEIGVFGPEASMKNIMLATSQLENDCTFVFLSYTSMHHLEALYKEHAHQFDGLLFSGLYPYQYILSHLGEPQKPHRHFDVADRDYFKVLLKVIYQNSGLDIRRIGIERPLIDIRWEELFGDTGVHPKTFFNSPAYHSYNANLYSAVLEKALQLWRNQEIDFVITRLTNLEKPLRELGVPFELLLPSPASMLETIAKLIHEIQSGHIVDSLSAVGILQPCHELSLEQSSQMLEHLHQLNLQQGSILILREIDSQFELITSNSVLRDFTNGYNSCLVSDYLHKHCDIPFSLGWGVGPNVIHAQKNAQRALLESERSQEHHPYLVTELDKLIGPLVLGKSAPLAAPPTAEISIMAKKLGISTTNLQKLISYHQRQNNMRVTRNDLALYLNVSLRTVNRILNKLSDTGAAQIVALEPHNAAGRPKAVYKLNMDLLF